MLLRPATLRALRVLCMLTWVASTAFIVLLAGCSDSPEDLRRAHSDALLPAYSIFGVGDAVEMRTWEDRDGGLWCAVGRPELFAVWRKDRPSAEWVLAYATTQGGRPVPLPPLESAK